MTLKMYRDGKACDADPDQVKSMEEAGWSKEPPKQDQPKAGAKASAKTAEDKPAAKG